MPVELPVIFFSVIRNPAVAVGIPLVFGMASGLITKTAIKTWYKDLKKPPLQPPPPVFPVAWSILYASMGLASHLLVKAYDSQLPGTELKQAADLAIKLYWSQFAFNMAWTPLFFGMKLILPALGDITVLTSLVYYMTYIAHQVDPRTTFLLAPYCGWLSFATYLNGGIWFLNFFPKKGDTSDGKKEL
ncbi:TspO/MBR-related protein [Meredithblackwellia eburnea MCA 4105]